MIEPYWRVGMETGAKFGSVLSRHHAISVHGQLVNFCRALATCRLDFLERFSVIGTATRLTGLFSIFEKWDMMQSENRGGFASGETCIVVRGHHQNRG
jgi:hypothetical protein